MQSSDVLEYNLTALRPFTNYSIQVQATTKHGFGALGHPVFARTEESGTTKELLLGYSGLQDPHTPSNLLSCLPSSPPLPSPPLPSPSPPSPLERCL